MSRTPRALPVYPWGDNERLYFGDGSDYYIYFDGTDFLIDSGTHSLEIDLATAGRTTIYGGDTAGDDFYIYANIADATNSLELLGGNDTKLRAAVDIDLLAAANVNIYGNRKVVGLGGTLTLEASAANGDILLTPHGTGKARFGTKTGTGDVAVDGYVSIKDAAGAAVKLATVA